MATELAAPTIKLITARKCGGEIAAPREAGRRLANLSLVYAAGVARNRAQRNEAGTMGYRPEYANYDALLTAAVEAAISLHPRCLPYAFKLVLGTGTQDRRQAFVLGVTSLS